MSDPKTSAPRRTPVSAEDIARYHLDADDVAYFEEHCTCGVLEYEPSLHVAPCPLAEIDVVVLAVGDEPATVGPDSPTAT